MVTTPQNTIHVGYKQTEIGVIPEGWDVGYLGNKTKKVGSGITPTGGEKVYKQEGRPFLRSQNVGWGTLLMEDIAFIDDATHETFKATEIEADDVFLNITGASIGRSAVADARVEGGNVNQHVCIIRTNQEELHPRFLNYFLLSNAGQRQIDSFQAGGNRQGLNFGQIRSFRLPVPPPPEQTAIATVLSDTDALIEKLKELIAKKKNIKQGAMQELLTGKRRLPGFSGEWEQVTYGQAFDFLRTASYSRDQLTDKDHIAYIHYGDIHTKWNHIVDLEKTKLPSIENSKAKNFDLVKDGDLIMADASEDYEGVGKSVEVKNIKEKKAISGLHTFLLRGKPGFFENGFKGYIHSNRIVKSNLDRYATGMKVFGVSKANLKLVYIPKPPLPEQKAIATVLSDMDAEIETLERKLAKYRQMKIGMMQQLLTGKIRIYGTHH